MKNLSIIACISQDFGLGYKGELLWHLPEDMRFFRQTTLNSLVVMGHKTFASIGKPLPKRQNIVLSRQTLAIPGVECYTNRDELDHYLARCPGAKFIIGGASLYQMYLNVAEKLYLTEVKATKPADTFFPKFDPAKFTRRVLWQGQQNNIKYEIVEYTRK